MEITITFSEDCLKDIIKILNSVSSNEVVTSGRMGSVRKDYKSPPYGATS